MASPRACSRCLRLLRRRVQNDQAVNLFDTPFRAFSSQFRQLQRKSLPRDPQQETLSVPPTTTSTITSNATAQPSSPTAAPPSSPPSSASPPNAPSIAEMQRAISSSVNSSPVSTNLPQILASRLRKTAQKATNPYMTYGISQSLFRSCSQQANYTIPEPQRRKLLTGQGPPKTSSGEDLGVPDPDTTASSSSSSSSSSASGSAASWWFGELGLQPTFSTWSQVTYLHMYIVLVRLRALEERDTVTKYQTYLLDHFSHAAEEKMLILHGMGARGIRNRYLKDLFLQWRGLLAAYDEGVVKGDAVLAGALWRNLWKGDEQVDWEKVAMVVAFVRSAVASLAEVGDQAVEQMVAQGRVFESAQMTAMQLVARESAAVREVPSDGAEVMSGSP